MDTEWEYLGLQKSGLRSYHMYKSSSNYFITLSDMRGMCMRYNNYRELYMSNDCIIYKKYIPKQKSKSLPVVQALETFTFAKLLVLIEESAKKTNLNYRERERFWREWYNNILSEIADNREMSAVVRQSVVESENLSDHALSILYSYQVPIVKLIQHSIRENVVSLNGSDTGTGKTIMTLISAKELNKSVYCVSPKSVLTPWRLAAESIQVDAYVNNYEQYKAGRTPYLTKIPGNKETGVRVSYKWTFPDPDRVLLIFDEAHKIKNVNTENFAMLHAAILIPGIRIVLLSATITDIPENSMSLLFSLGIITSDSEYKTFLRKYSPPADLGYTYVSGSFELREPEKTMRTDCLRRNPYMQYLSTVLYPKYGARLQIKDCKDFPMNVITPILCDIPEHLSEIRAVYNELQEYNAAVTLQKQAQITELKCRLNSGTLEQAEQIAVNKKIRTLEESTASSLAKTDYTTVTSAVTPLQGTTNTVDISTCILTLRLRARQRVELLKAGTIVDLACDILREGASAVIFVCFNDTLRKIHSTLLSRGESRLSVIHGKQTAAERDSDIALFQTDISRVIIVNIYAGGTGVSLHDVTGRHPRRSISTVTDDAVALIQGLGRIPRVGAKSGCIQYILYCAGTVEEHVHARVVKKVNDINTLNDSDLNVS